MHLRSSARHLVTRELVSGARDRYDEATLAEHLVPLSSLVPGDAVALLPLDEAVASVLAAHPRFDPRLDAEMAVAVHRALPLTRLQASDDGLWRYLAVVRHPEAVRHRWEQRTFEAMRQRFWNVGVRSDGNVFSRWWWAAELTLRDGDYALTRTALSHSALATHLFTRQLAHHRPTLAACIEVLSQVPSQDVDGTLKILGKLTSTRVLEAMDDAALHALVREAHTLAISDRG